jgi:hypothetical protein
MVNATLKPNTTRAVADSQAAAKPKYPNLKITWHHSDSPEHCGDFSKPMHAQHFLSRRGILGWLPKPFETAQY